VRFNKPSRIEGFTLIEVLVSMTMMAMVAAVVLSATRSGMSMWNKGTSHIDSMRRSRVVLDILNDQIRGAIPLVYTVRTAQGAAALLAFDGNRTGIRFVSRTSFKDGPDGVPRWIELRWNADSVKPEGELVVEERRIFPPDNSPDPTVYWRGEILHAQSCSFDFLMDAQGTRPPLWLQEWHYPANPALPKAVRLNCIEAGKTTTQSLIALDYWASSMTGFTLR
jgi:prepilin-type N-terminal cleavage/methylation domain-containing protein